MLPAAAAADLPPAARTAVSDRSRGPRQTSEAATGRLDDPRELKSPRARGQGGALTRLAAAVAAFNRGGPLTRLGDRPVFASFNPLHRSAGATVQHASPERGGSTGP